jgi:DNA-binding MarR family transcriptional regulator
MIRPPDQTVTTPTRLPLAPLLMAVKRAAVAHAGQELAAAGHGTIRESHGCVFGYVEPQGSRLTELAERSGLTKQAVGEAVDDLVRQGYAVRAPDPTDGRAKLVRLTDSGDEVVAIIDRAFEQIERAWAEQVGEERMSVLRETLEELQDVVADRSPTPA